MHTKHFAADSETRVATQAPEFDIFLRWRPTGGPQYKMFKPMDLSRFNNLERLAATGDCCCCKQIDMIGQCPLKEVECVGNDKACDCGQPVNLEHLATVAASTLIKLDCSWVFLLEDINPLAYCIQLRHLDLSHTRVSDIRPLENCIALQHLDLSETSVSDVEPLAACMELQHINLSHTGVSDISPLKDCRALQHLDLYVTFVAHVSSLAACRNLQFLYLAQTDVEDISSLAACMKLQHLDLSFTSVSDVSSLAACRNLKFLNLTETEVEDFDFVQDVEVVT